MSSGAFPREYPWLNGYDALLNPTLILLFLGKSISFFWLNFIMSLSCCSSIQVKGKGISIYSITTNQSRMRDVNCLSMKYNHTFSVTGLKKYNIKGGKYNKIAQIEIKREMSIQQTYYLLNYEYH